MKKIKSVLSKKLLKLPILDWVLLVAGLSVFSGLTLATIAKSSIWFDEAFGAYLIKFNFFDVAKYTAADVHPPLFYWALKVWGHFFGHTELGLRSMSVFFGCIAIIFGYLLINKLFNKKAARLSLLFMIISPMLIRYGQEMRMYTMVAAIATVATYALVVAVKSKRKLPWVIYGVLLALGLWTHYFVFVVWLAHWIWRATIVAKEGDKKSFLKRFFSKDWVMAHVIAVAMFAPWLPFVAKQLFTVQAYGFWIPSVTVDTIPNFLTNVVYYLNSNQVNSWLATGFIFLVVVLAVSGSMAYRKKDDDWRKKYRLIAFVAFAPVVTLFLMSMPPFRSYFIDRYLIASTLFIALFMGVTFAYGLEAIPKRGRILLVVLTVVLMGAGVGSVWNLGNYNKNSSSSNNTRQIIEAATAKAEKGEPIIAATPWLFYEAAFYNTNENPVYFINPSEYKYGSLDMLKYDDWHKIKDINLFAKQHSKIWYVGCPGNEAFAAPYSNWRKIREVVVNDSVSGEPLYKAIEYQTN